MDPQTQVDTTSSSSSSTLPNDTNTQIQTAEVLSTDAVIQSTDRLDQLIGTLAEKAPDSQMALDEIATICTNAFRQVITLQKKTEEQADQLNQTQYKDPTEFDLCADTLKSLFCATHGNEAQPNEHIQKQLDTIRQCSNKIPGHVVARMTTTLVGSILTSHITQNTDDIGSVRPSKRPYLGGSSIRGGSTTKAFSIPLPNPNPSDPMITNPVVSTSVPRTSTSGSISSSIRAIRGDSTTHRGIAPMTSTVRMKLQANGISIRPTAETIRTSYASNDSNHNTSHTPSNGINNNNDTGNASEGVNAADTNGTSMTTRELSTFPRNLQNFLLGTNAIVS